MTEIIQKLYDLAENSEVVDSYEVMELLGLRPVWGCEGYYESDSVADLAALMEETFSQGYENATS